ncbi:T-cell surface antigen CD2 isoform X4 [Oreochromis niloticus]|uniref:T-cell surface antigen CD2 isoform X4 n=1 Tax=Oreochromis niloticus TaxID=8128 RepID=UPI000DF1CE3D|nr:T-cell surface antigen CD2 isoform X4 [Oreochromis niloticus]
MRIVKKMASAATIAVFLLCCYFIVSSGSQADCNVYAATGSNFTVQLKHVLKDSDSLRWFKNKKVIFLRKSKLVIRGKNDDVDSNGKLKLTQLTKDKSGRYRPEVHRADGTSAVDLPSVRLCVLDPVQKPKVTVTCDKTKVTFTCDAGQSEKNFPIKWFMDNKNGPENETGKELKRPVKDVLNARFSCNVSNPVSSEISQPVQQDCIKSSFPDICGIDVCIPVRTGAGILLLVILIVIVCCIQRKANLIKDKVELPLRKHHHHHQKQLVGSVLEPDICADCDLEGDNRI